ncbi:MAG TPA: SRPBCC domain-containing protein, partial [Flavobacteriales bacterium]|nr:SRPBCC domain-containing protein [Flavobacteriales bacterium]
LRVGGAYRWVWRNQAGDDMGMGGTYREVKRPERIVSTEKFDQAWYPGEAVGTLVLHDDNGRTRMELTVEYESAEAREAVMRSPMASGLDAGYSSLDAFLTLQTA